MVRIKIWQIRCARFARRICLVGSMVFCLPAAAPAVDQSEVLRLWKFAYQFELTAYGVQYMSRDDLLGAADRLETAALQTMVTNTRARICIDATQALAGYFRLSVVPVKRDERVLMRQTYEKARAGCMRVIGSDPAKYPLGWPR